MILPIFRTLSLYLLLALLAAGAAAQHMHLVPEEGLLSSRVGSDDALRQYRALLSDVFTVWLDESDLVARVIILPSFESESVAGVRTRREKEEIVHEVFFAEADSSLWYAGWANWDDPWDENKARSVHISWRFSPIEAETSRLIGEAWERAIMDTRYPSTPHLGMDGTTVYFSRWVFYRGMISGKAWDPLPKTIPGELLRLGEIMQEVAEGRATDMKLRKSAQKALRLIDTEYRQ